MNKLELEQIEWPVLRFGSPNCTVLKYESGEWLANASPRTLESWKRMDQYFIIDSLGRRHNLSNPEFVDSPKGFKGFVSRFSGSARPVRWQKDTVGVLTVDEVRALIMANFDEYDTVWQAYDLDEMKQRLASAKSVTGIMEIFG